jgi:hypoxanthine phosphoribosyltransferase
MSSPRVLISASELQSRVQELAAEIDRDLARDAVGGAAPVCLVGVLKGSWIFLADLARAMKTPTRIEFLRASSYGDGQTSSGEIILREDLDASIEGHDVILVEDILDTGLTMGFLIDLLKERKPRSLRSAVMLNKPSRRQREVAANYVGFTIEDLFVIGYGLDYAEQYRGLPDVCLLDAG